MLKHAVHLSWRSLRDRRWGISNQVHMGILGYRVPEPTARFVHMTARVQSHVTYFQLDICHRHIHCHRRGKQGVYHLTPETTVVPLWHIVPLTKSEIQSDYTQWDVYWIIYICDMALVEHYGTNVLFCHVLHIRLTTKWYIFSHWNLKWHLSSRNSHFTNKSGFGLHTACLTFHHPFTYFDDSIFVGFHQKLGGGEWN